MPEVVMGHRNCSLVYIAALLILLTSAFAQSNSAQVQTPQDKPPEGAASEPQAPAAALIPKLRIGAGDEMDITVYRVPELSQHVRVAGDGTIYLPLLGNVPVEGLTAEEAQNLLAKRLVEGGFVKQPRVSIYVKEYTTQGVSVVGEVNRPGVYPVLGSRNLLDVLLLAGGLSQKAGSTIRITHRDRPQEPLIVKIGSDLQPVDSTISVLPGDVVVVPKADIVYLLGGVTQPGGYVIPDSGIKLLELFAKAVGPVKGASLNKTMLIRKDAGGVKETTISLKSIMQGKTPDLTLQAEDIVYIPTIDHSVARSTILTAASYALIFRP